MSAVSITTIPVQYLLSNYGTFFQHYALRKVLKSFGFVPYRMPYPDEPISSWLWKYRMARRFLGNVLRRARGHRSVRIDMPNRLFEPDYRKLIGPIYEKKPSHIALAIVGSDQIWQSASPFAWLVNFNGARRISYAASSDWRRCSAERRWIDGVGRFYSNIDAVSVREDAGVAAFAALGLNNPKAVCVCDPTTLLENSDYLEIASGRALFEKPTLFCYFVNERAPVAKLKAIAEKLQVQLRILGIQGAERAIPSKYRARLTPCQFLSAMRDAKYVVTNSYHGMLFALSFKRNFLFVLQSDSSGASQNIRQMEVLARYNLESRGLSGDADYDTCAEILCADVDWQDVVGRVKVFRQFSYDWLKSSIKGAGL